MLPTSKICQLNCPNINEMPQRTLISYNIHMADRPRGRQERILHTAMEKILGMEQKSIKKTNQIKLINFEQLRENRFQTQDI